jgi:hypothetical protein
MALVRNFRLPIGIGISADYIETFGIIESGDTNTGSVVARGGAGIAGTLNVGGNINLHYGNYYTGFKSSSTANTVYTLPSTSPAFGASVLTSNSTGLMHWDDVHALLNIDRATYGSFYSNQAQQVIGADTATPITLNGTYESYKVSIYGGSGTSSRIKIDTAGTYNIQFSAQIDLVNGTQPQKGDFWFRIDGVNVPESNTRMSILGKDYETVLALNFIYTFTAGQYFEIVMSSSDSNWALARDTGITNPTRPGIPSMILSVTPVAETVGGAGSGNTGILSINGLNSGQQYIELGSSGTIPNIDSSGFTHTINIPIAGSGSTGLITTNAQTIAGSKTFSSAIIGNLSGTSTTSQNLNTVSATTGTGHYLLFSPVNGGSGVAVSSDPQLQFSPSTNILTVDTLSGNLSGTAATVTNFYGTLTGNVTGTATTSQNVNVTTTTRSTDHYLLFTNRSSGSGVALTTSIVGMGLTYNPATNTLSAQFFTGTATTSRNVVVNTTTINQNHYLLFSNRSSGSGIALTASTIGIGFTVNPAENTLSAGLFAGNISGTAATFANFYGNTFANLTGVEFSGGDVLVKSAKSIKIYEVSNTYNTSFKASSSLASNTDYTLPVAKPGTGSSILQSDTAGTMIWVKAASNKATYVLSFGAGFTPTTGLDSVSIAIPYANDGSTSLTYTIKRVDVRTETAPGASTLAFYFERHTAGDATWASANTIKGAASANFSVASTNFASSFTTITSSSGNNGEVASGNYLRVNFASVGSAANVSISIMIQEN